jgi:hypothetical protein
MLPIGPHGGAVMLAWIAIQIPLALFPAPFPPTCQLEVLTPVVMEERVLRDFEREVAQYVRLHRRLERDLPPEHLFDDLEDMSAAVDALHAALVDARPHAQAGAFFTPPVASVLTERLERASKATGFTAADVLFAMNAGYRFRGPEPQVNERFPLARHVRLWPALLDVLPALPDELEYRFVGRDLVLLDTHADLVVDVLKDALPNPYANLARDSAPARKNPQPPAPIEG